MSTNPLVPMTKLDAVNTMLATIGQSPINSLDVTGIRDAAIAELHLDNVTREQLTKGWSFNSDEDYPLAPDENGNILIPSSALDVDPTDGLKRYVQRSNDSTMMLYNKTDRTFTFDSPVKCNIIWAFDFDEIPQAARTFFATRAARLFQSNIVGSDVLFRFTQLHEDEARQALQTAEDRNLDLNILNSPTETNAVIYHRRTGVRR